MEKSDAFLVPCICWLLASLCFHASPDYHPLGRLAVPKKRDWELLCGLSVLWTGSIPRGVVSLQFLFYPSCLDYAEGEHHFGSIVSEVNLWRLQWYWNVLPVFVVGFRAAFFPQQGTGLTDEFCMNVWKMGSWKMWSMTAVLLSSSII